MKKLMIAAAAAAMIGAAQANPNVGYVYDFSANLRTTTARAGVQSRTVANYTVKLGQDATTQEWWHECDEAVFLKSLGIIQSNAVQTCVLNLGNVRKAISTTDESSPFYGLDYNQALRWMATNPDCFACIEDASTRQAVSKYNTPDPRKRGAYCAQYSYQVVTINPAQCYRTAGSAVLRYDIVAQDCCGAWSFYAPNDWNITAGGTATQVDAANMFFDRFGGQTKELSRMCEVYYDGGMTLGLSFAGQGTWNDRLYTGIFEDMMGDTKSYTFDGVANISGNIVGLLPAPQCGCCGSGVDGIAWDCQDAQPTQTAAFGTFTIRFNAAKTRTYNIINKPF